jgi:short-subunit dehydrogenase
MKLRAKIMKTNDYVILSGASSGIGLEFAKTFAKNGYNLVLIARTEKVLRQIQDDLQSAYKIQGLIVPGDLAEEKFIKSFYKLLKDMRIAPKILINNAGFANYGKFVDVDIDKQMDLIDLNIKSLTLMTKLFLEQLPSTQGARILNVSSMAGLIPGPYISVYAASKAYIYSFSQSVASELKEKGIQVSVLCPADIKTNFQARAGIASSKLKLIAPEKLVAAAYPEFMKGKRVIIPNRNSRFLKLMLRFFPENQVVDSIYKQRETLN